MKELFALDKKGNFKHWTVEVEGNTIIVKHGRYKGKMQEQRTVCEGKNIGRSNETTPEQQALFESESKYNKQLDKLYRPTQDEAASVGQVLPMLAKNYLDSGHRIIWPCYGSPKLDGVRCIADVNGEVVTLHSRGGKTYPCPEHIREHLVKLSLKTKVSRFDGELYKHGLSLQEIVSAVKKHNDNTPSIEYHVFDIPSNKLWKNRHLDVINLASKVEEDSSIKVVVCARLDNPSAAEVALGLLVEMGYEGLMLRNDEGMYEFNHRSADLQKWKLMQDLEAKVIGVEKDKLGEGVLVCHLAKDKEKIFKCKMKGTHETREYSNMEKLVGQWITVRYQAFTDDGIPQFPVGLYVRECDDEGNPLE